MELDYAVILIIITGFVFIIVNLMMLVYMFISLEDLKHKLDDNITLQIQTLVRLGKELSKNKSKKHIKNKINRNNVICRGNK